MLSKPSVIPIRKSPIKRKLSLNIHPTIMQSKTSNLFMNSLEISIQFHSKYYLLVICQCRPTIFLFIHCRQLQIKRWKINSHFHDFILIFSYLNLMQILFAFRLIGKICLIFWEIKFERFLVGIFSRRFHQKNYDRTALTTDPKQQKN
jgi:hypothetical protein